MHRLGSNSYRYDPRKELEELQMQLPGTKSPPFSKLLDTDLNPFIQKFPKIKVGFGTDSFRFPVFAREHQVVTPSMNLSISIVNYTQSYKIAFPLLFGFDDKYTS
jgi:hypothetical protein